MKSTCESLNSTTSLCVFYCNVEYEIEINCWKIFLMPFLISLMFKLTFILFVFMYILPCAKFNNILVSLTKKIFVNWKNFGNILNNKHFVFFLLSFCSYWDNFIYVKKVIWLCLKKLFKILICLSFNHRVCNYLLCV